MANNGGKKSYPFGPAQESMRLEAREIQGSTGPASGGFRYTPTAVVWTCWWNHDSIGNNDSPYIRYNYEVFSNLLDILEELVQSPTPEDKDIRCITPQYFKKGSGSIDIPDSLFVIKDNTGLISISLKSKNQQYPKLIFDFKKASNAKLLKMVNGELQELSVGEYSALRVKSWVFNHRRFLTQYTATEESGGGNYNNNNNSGGASDNGGADYDDDLGF